MSWILRDIADRLRGLLDARDNRLTELEEQLERVMQGPPFSISRT